MNSVKCYLTNCGLDFGVIRYIEVPFNFCNFIFVEGEFCNIFSFSNGIRVKIIRNREVTYPTTLNEKRDIRNIYGNN